ncbi:MAG: NAD(P)H-dependent oxidoreductase [Endomicrobiales bacterium]|jgi:NAD(P)H dehydrogenase (quinone)
MNTLIGFAHNEKKSFNAAMKDHVVSVSPPGGIRLWCLIFKPYFESLAQRQDCTELSGSDPVNYLMEQRIASANNAFRQDIKIEMDKVRWAEMIIFQCPIWWLSPCDFKGMV